MLGGLSEATKSPGAILDSRRLAHRVEARGGLPKPPEQCAPQFAPGANLFWIGKMFVARPWGALCAPNFAPGEIVLGPPLTRLDFQPRVQQNPLHPFGGVNTR